MTTSSVIFSDSTDIYPSSPARRDIDHVLRAIHKEVVELGKREEEHFIKREFFMDLDDTDTNKEEHVVVLIRKRGKQDLMMLQITYFSTLKKGSHIRHAIRTREVDCVIENDSISIEKSEYQEEETMPLLSKILEGIKNKKKLLELIKDKHQE